MDNRMLGLSSAEAKMKRGNPKGDTPPFGTRLCKAKCSVLYPLSAWLRKVGESLVRGAGFVADEKSLVSVPVSVTETKLFG